MLALRATANLKDTVFGVTVLSMSSIARVND